MNTQTPDEILVVDDTPANLKLLSMLLAEQGYRVRPASNGVLALRSVAAKAPDLILLDIRMPDMDGYTLCRQIKADPRLAPIPVIFISALNETADKIQGFSVGGVDYLTKPFERETLLAIVAAAVRDRLAQLELLKQLEQQRDTLTMLRYGEFQFRTLAEAKRLTALLSSVCPQPEKVAMGLSELLINAVEHGNLGITYKEKTKLIQDNAWEGELNQRLALPQYASRRASVMLTRDNHEIRFVVADQGDGFDWQPFMEFSPDRAFDPHGRGISMARMLSFDAIEYQGNGNTVVATVKLG